MGFLYALAVQIILFRVLVDLSSQPVALIVAIRWSRVHCRVAIDLHRPRVAAFVLFFAFSIFPQPLDF